MGPVFQYLNYREFLKDWYEDAKKNRRGFSFRVFSKTAGFGSPNFLKRVMEGERNLTEESISKCIHGLGLNKQESDFFKKLVYYTQSINPEQKNLYYEQLTQSKKFHEIKPLEKSKYDYYADWYHPVIRELMTSKKFDGTPEWLSKRIYPLITVHQAQKSMELLMELGLIQKIGKYWVQTNPVTTTGNEAGEHIIIGYHQTMLDLSRALLPHVMAEDRDMSVLVLGIGKNRFAEIKKRIQEFRKEILKMVANDNDPEDVVYLAMQFMPVIRRPQNLDRKGLKSERGKK